MRIFVCSVNFEKKRKSRPQKFITLLSTLGTEKKTGNMAYVRKHFLKTYSKA